MKEGFSESVTVRAPTYCSFDFFQPASSGSCAPRLEISNARGKRRTSERPSRFIDAISSNLTRGRMLVIALGDGIRQEAEALEQEKLRFEELSRQQKEFMQGRVEMGEKLTKALTHLDRETYEAQRRVEQLLVIKDTFNHHLDVIDSLNPEQWNPSDLRHDLGRALGMIDEAREEYIKGSSRIHLLTAGATSQNQPAAPAPSPSSATSAMTLASTTAPSSLPVTLNKDTFRFWLFCGLGFTVPLAATAFVIFAAWLIFR